MQAKRQGEHFESKSQQVSLMVGVILITVRRKKKKESNDMGGKKKGFSGNAGHSFTGVIFMLCAAIVVCYCLNVYGKLSLCMRACTYAV